MSKQYILTGDPKELDKVIRENRIRINRGVISITPVEPETEFDENAIKTLEDHFSYLEQERARLTDSQIELTELTGEIIAIILDNGIVISEDLIPRLANFGISVPKTDENVPKTDENVPEQPENVPNADYKNIEVEDMKEVDLDADDKTPQTNDSKDVQADDSKEAETAKKTSKRTKKTE